MKMNFPRMFKYPKILWLGLTGLNTCFSEMFQSFLSGLKVSENKTEQNFHPLSTVSLSPPQRLL